MTLWQSIDFTGLFDGESSRAITALQILEAVDRNSAGTGCKLQQSTLLFGVPGANDFPEVLNHIILLLVATIIGMLFPVVNVDIGNTADEEFKFTFIKHVDEVSRNELVEAGDERVELFFNSLDNLPFGDKPESC